MDKVILVVRNGVSKPTVSVTTDSEKTHFIIKATDDEKITKVEFRINQDKEQEYELNLDSLDYKEFEYVVKEDIYELKQGENLIEVTVTNSDGVTEETGVVRIVK